MAPFVLLGPAIGAQLAHGPRGALVAWALSGTLSLALAARQLRAAIAAGG